MTEHETEIPADSAEQIRQIAREEARDVYDDELVEDEDCEEWSVREMMDRFEISRRTALGAMGLLIVGSVTDPVEAVMRSYAGTAEAQTGDLTVPGTLSADAVSTEQMGSERHFAGSYSGADADARLDNALSSASGGDRIFLENATYDSARTVSTVAQIIGTYGGFEGTEITADWTLSNGGFLSSVSLIGMTLTINATSARVTDFGVSGTATISVEANNVLVEQGDGAGSVVFASGTDGGLADSLTRISVTDNGTNTIGDIS